MKIIATNLGKKREINYKGKVFTTGIYKTPTDTSIFLDVKDVLNDDVVDRKHHGGILQAVYAYSFKHYDFWKKQYPKLEWNYGMFGENLTIDDLEETKIHVGDTFKVGEVILEVTKPRQPCYKLGVKFQDNQLVRKFWNTTMCGVYFKVLQKGNVKEGDVFKQLKSHPKNPTIADVYIGKRVLKGF